MKALVTGANGFLGRHVVAALLGRGHQVRALVRPAARLEALGWPAAVEVVRADLRSSRELGRRVRRRGRARPPRGGDVRRRRAAVRGHGRRHRAAAGGDGGHSVPEGGAGEQLLRLRLERDPGHARRGLAPRAGSRAVRARRLLDREVLAGARDPPARGTARLGPHRAAPGLHLGAGPRLRGRARPAGGTVPRRDRPPVALPAHARGELRRPVRARGHRPARGGRDLQRGGRRGRAHLELPGRVPAGDRRSGGRASRCPTRWPSASSGWPVPPSSRAARSCRRSWSRAVSSRGSSRSATPTGARGRSSGGARRSASRSAWRGRSATDRGRRAGRRRPHALRAATSSP